jgi:hypothetical protein
MKLLNGLYRTVAGSTVKISGNHSGRSEVEFDWLEEPEACCDCSANAYPEYDNDGWCLTWDCEVCDGGRAVLTRVDEKRKGEVMKFRKKPVEIEAIQWDGTNECLQKLAEFGAPLEWNPSVQELIIGTLEDGPQTQVRHYASVGDWIIKGVQNEFYPCKDSIFQSTYDAI